MADELREKVALHFMVQCEKGEPFECPYLKDCPHEDKELCQWQLDHADEIIPIIEKQERERIIAWGKEDCPHMERTTTSKSRCYRCWQALEGGK